MVDHIEFIPKAGACLATTNVLEPRGKVKWMWRRTSQNPVDNGWRIMSDIDTSDYLDDPASWKIVDFNDICYIEPALIGIYDFEVGSELSLVRDDGGIHVIDTPSGREIPRENFYVPPQFRA